MVGPRRSFVIVASQYNQEFVQGLVDFAAQELAALSPNSQILLRQVPGAFEIPLVVQEFADKENISAILALGVVIEGETRHAEYIGRTVTDALMQISLKSRMPVIHEVMVVKDEAAARKRCLDPELNRGLEAARAAVQISQLMADIKARA